MAATKSPTLRTDLSAAPRWRSGHRWWVIHDPVRNSYHRLSDPDLQELVRGTANPELLAHAAQAGLLAGISPRMSTSNPQWNPLAWRLGGVPMDTVATTLSRFSGVFFHPLAIGCWTCAMVLAILTLLVGWERLRLQLPSFSQFIATENAVLLVGVVAISKVIHELAHAVACKRLGGRVGEIGVMLLCGVPCMYCDVTDSWRFASRLHRAAVMAAGMYLEWILATIAVFVWWLTSSQWLSYLCLDVIFVCGISTLLFNGNPLGRYDGYFILCDFLDSPNLYAAAGHGWHNVVRTLLGQPVARGMDFVLASYHLLGTFYRTFITLVIGIGGARWMWSLHLKPVACVLIITTVVVAAMPWYNGWKAWLLGRGPWSSLPRFQRWLIGGLLLLILMGWLAHERPVWVAGQGTVELLNSASVFAPPGGGRIQRVVYSVGQRVDAGDELATLDSPELQQRYLALQTRCEQLAVRLQGLERRALNEPHLLEQSQAMREAIHAADRQLELTEAQMQNLVLRAPQSGVVFPPADQPYEPTTEATGNVIAGAALWCRIGDPDHCAIRLFVDRDLRRHIGPGDRVRVTSESDKGQVLELTVTTIIEANDRGATHSDNPSATDQQVEVWCQLPPGNVWPLGSQVWGWVEGTGQPVWKSWCASLYLLVAP